VQLDAALNNMRQGLQMYNAKGRVIVTNRKYLEMYGLSPDAVKPGWTLRDVLHLRKAAGTLAEDPDQFFKMIDLGKIQTRVVQLPTDGPSLSPMRLCRVADGCPLTTTSPNGGISKGSAIAAKYF
jgi:PAS domain-containing protein